MSEELGRLIASASTRLAIIRTRYLSETYENMTPQELVLYMTKYPDKGLEIDEYLGTTSKQFRCTFIDEVERLESELKW